MKKLLLALTLLAASIVTPAFSQTGGINIDQLPAGGATQSTDEVATYRSGHTYKTMPASLPGQIPTATILGNTSGVTAVPAPLTVTGTGAPVLNNFPALISPALGTPASGVATNLTGVAAGLTAGNVSTINGLITPGTNVTFTGSGTSGSPYVVSSTGGGGSTPAGSFPQIQYNGGNGSLAALLTETNAAFKAHNTIENGLSFDPRDSTYGAICGSFNTFAGNSTTTTFSYTIPFTGSSSTDNTNFMVFYEPTNGGGSATILTTSQFTVTGVNSGSGGTITLQAAPPTGDTLIVVHDDGPGIVAAATAAVASGGYVSVPDGCTIYSSQTLGTQLPEGAQLIGQNFTPNYNFNSQSSGSTTKPYLYVIAPSGALPAAGFNVSGKINQFFEGFEITSNIPGAGLQGMGFQNVPVLIGVVGNNGAGGTQLPGITAQYMTLNYGNVGFGASIGGNAQYIFSTLRFNNFVANNAGIYGPLSDQQIIGNDFVDNGGFGTFGSAGGYVIGPTQGAAGASSAGRVEYNRFEFNSEGIVTQDASLINMEGNQFDGNTYCGLDLNGFWNQINITGGWFRGNANGGSGGSGSTAAGKDAQICFNNSSASNGLHVSNVNFYTNYGEGYTAPLGTAGATTPSYGLDFSNTAALDDITFDGGDFQGVAGGNGAYVTDFAVYRGNRPTHLRYSNLYGQASLDNIANGKTPSQAIGLHANSWTALDIVGDGASAYNGGINTQVSTWGAFVSKNSGLQPTYLVDNSFSIFDCDVVNTRIVPNINANLQGNPVIDWLPSPGDPAYGAGFFQSHEADTLSCRLGGLTWAAVPVDYKIYAQSSNNTETGTWADSSAYGGNYGVVSSTNGSTYTMPFTTAANQGVVYVWYLMQGSNGGTFTVQLDSGTTQTIATQGQNSFTFPINSSSQTLGAVRIPVLATGSHNIHIAVTSATSASNTVTIIGLGTPAPNVLPKDQPTLFLAGQTYYSNSGGGGSGYAAANIAFNNDEKNQAKQLFSDGLLVGFADVQNYFNFSTDIYPGTANFDDLGQTHIAQAFSGAMQASTVSMNAVNPMDYGASCNTKLLNESTYGEPPGIYQINVTQGSNVLSIVGEGSDPPYRFQPGIATQTGGGDVGKVVELSCGFAQSFNTADVGTMNYIASVNTANNTATMGFPATGSCSNAGGFALLTGYPSNPLDPSTAQDDTLAIETASNAAYQNGGQVFLPTNCAVHNLVMHYNTRLQGNSAGLWYGNNGPVSPTILYADFSGNASDVDLQGVPNNTGIKIAAGSIGTEYKDFQLICPDFPYINGNNGMSSAGIGSTGSTALNADTAKITNVSVSLCPVGINEPLGLNQTVNFTGSISGTTMTVSAITSTNNYLYSKSTASFTATVSGTTMTVSAISSGTIAVGQTIKTGVGITQGTSITALGTGTGGTGTYTLSASATVSSSEGIVTISPGDVVADFLAAGRPVTGAGLTANTRIITPAVGGGVGTYTVNNSQTVGSEALVSSPISNSTEITMDHVGLYADAIGINGDLSDSILKDVIFTGDFSIGWVDGPNGSSSASDANRIIGGRFEEIGNTTENGDSPAVLITGGVGQMQFTGTQWQFNKGPAITTNGAINVQVTGGMMEGNNPGYAQVVLGGATDFVMSGVQILEPNYSAGGNAANIFEIAPGSSGTDYIAMTGGDARTCCSSAVWNTTYGMPAHYKQDVQGEPMLDTTIIPTVSGCSFSALKGGAYSGQVTAGVNTSCTLALTLPTVPNGWNCTGGDITAGVNFAQTAHSATGCSLTGTPATSGDIIGFSATAH